MQAGKLQRRIIIQQLSRAKNADGEEIETWTDLETVKAEVRPLSGWERYHTEQELSGEVARFTFRYKAGLSPLNNRISYDSKIWDIIGIAEVGRRRYAEITAQVVK